MEHRSLLTYSFSTAVVALGLFCSSGFASAQEKSPAAASSNIQMVDAIVAVVNDEIITHRDLAARIRTAEQQLQRQGLKVPPREILERQVLERAVVDRALVQFARENGIRVDEATIDNAFNSLAQQNNLTVPQFRERLLKEGINPRQFRTDISEEILLYRLREREVDARVTVTEAEVDAFMADQSGGEGAIEWNVAQILLAPTSDKPTDVALAREKAQSFYERAMKGEPYEALLREASNASDATRAGELGFRTRDRMPELFMAAIEKLAPGQIAPPVQSSAGFHVLKLVAKRTAGASSVAAGATAQQTKARHILLRTGPSLTDTQAEAQLLSLRSKIVEGQTKFEDAAKAFSADNSAVKGGELGWLLPGDTVPEFDTAMNGLKPGEISTPVRSQYGWHLILVEDRRTQPVPLEKQRQLAKVQLRERKADEEYIEFARRIRDKAYVEFRLDR